MVSRWRRSTATEISSAIAAVSVRAVFDGVQSLQTYLQILFVRLVPLRNSGIKIPAVVIETRLAGESLDLRTRLLLDLQKANHHVGHLHARVVDVVLNVDFPARGAQQPDERVAENGIAQMSDVRGLVRIDAGVLDQNFAGRNFDWRSSDRRQCGRHPRTVDLTLR